MMTDRHQRDEDKAALWRVFGLTDEHESDDEQDIDFDMDLSEWVAVMLELMADPPKRLDDDEDDGNGTSTGLLTRPETRTKKPHMYKVLLLNDDYTPMEFVVHILQRFFRMTVDQATEVMLHVHQKGVGVCGVFTYEVAETKVNQVLTFAQQHEHPLQCTLEKE